MNAMFTHTHSMTYLKKPVFVVFVVCIFIPGCSTKFAYNYLDWMIQWYIGDFVTLNDDQRFQLDELVQASLSWHRQTQLPDYVDALQDLRRDLNGTLSPQTINNYYAQYRQFASVLITHITVPGGEMLSTLTPKQRAELIKNLESQNLEYLEEYTDKDPKKHHAKRIEHITERLEYWLDDINKAQKQSITQWSHALTPAVTLWIEDRRAWQQKLNTLLNTAANAGQITQGLQTLFNEHEKTRTPEYQTALQHNTQRSIELIHQVLLHMNTKQRTYLDSKLQSLIRQFEAIPNRA